MSNDDGSDSNGQGEWDELIEHSDLCRICIFFFQAEGGIRD